MDIPSFQTSDQARPSLCHFSHGLKMGKAAHLFFCLLPSSYLAKCKFLKVIAITALKVEKLPLVVYNAIAEHFSCGLNIYLNF